MKPLIKDNLNFKSLSAVKELIPRKSIINSFLFYSGALELSLAHDGRFVAAHTTRQAVYEFWRCVMEDALSVATRVQLFSKLIADEGSFSSEKTFTILQESWAKYSDPWTRSAYFFLLNHCSESGLISSGKLNIKYFSPLSITNLKSFKPNNFHIHFDPQEDFMTALASTDEADYLLLPVGRYSYNLFEHGKSKGSETTTVHHKKLYENLKNHPKKWVVLYKSHPDIFKLYADHNITMINKYGRKTTQMSACEDIVIANF